MDAILRAFIIYTFLLIAFRLSGKRTMAQVTTFDFVLLLIVSEATQQALLANDYSITNAVIVITTFLAIEILLSLITGRVKFLDKWINGTPLIILENGKPLKEKMRNERIEESDILEAARHLQGLERLDQIKYAILEKSGGITIIPQEEFR